MQTQATYWQKILALHIFAQELFQEYVKKKKKPY
jgi:hypothetical protein